MNRKVTNLTLITLFCASPVFMQAQSVGQVENSAEKVSNTIGKVGGLFKKKDKKQKDTTASATTAGTAPSATGTGKTLTIRTVSDFAAGDSLIFTDDFSTTEIGKFPAKWKTNTSGQVVSLDEIAGKWFALSSAGVYIPKIKGGLPKDFTIEFDLVIANSSGSHQFHMDFEDALNGNFDLYPDNPYVQVRIYEGGSVYTDSKAQNLNSNVRSRTYNDGGKTNHFAIRKRGERLEMFIGDEKTLDINKAFEAKRVYSTFKFYSEFSSPANYLVSNFKITAL